MDEGIANNELWQVQWQLLVIQSGSQYRTAQWGFGRGFFSALRTSYMGCNVNYVKRSAL